jgi:hypothetical protein
MTTPATTDKKTTPAPAPASAMVMAATTTRPTPPQEKTKTKDKKDKKDKKEKKPEEPDRASKKKENESHEEPEGEAEEEVEESEDESELDETDPEYPLALLKHKQLVSNLQHDTHMELFHTACTQLQKAYSTCSLLSLNVQNLELAMIAVQDSQPQNHMVKMLWQSCMSLLKHLRKAEKQQEEAERKNGLPIYRPHSTFDPLVMSRMMGLSLPSRNMKPHDSPHKSKPSSSNSASTTTESSSPAAAAVATTVGAVAVENFSASSKSSN